MLSSLAFTLGSLSTASARSLAEIRQSGVINMANSMDTPPFFNMKDSKPTGFEVELGEAIGREMGLKVKWVTKPWERLLKEVNNKASGIDMVIASYTITSTRQQEVDFSIPYYCTGGVIATRPGGPKTTKQLAGYDIGAEANTVYFSFLSKLPFKVQRELTTKGAQAVIDGDVTAVITDNFMALDVAKENPGKLQVGPLLWKEYIGAAFAKGSPELKQAVDKAIKNVMADGTYGKISNKYFGKDIRCK